MNPILNQHISEQSIKTDLYVDSISMTDVYDDG